MVEAADARPPHRREQRVPSQCGDAARYGSWSSPFAAADVARAKVRSRSCAPTARPSTGSVATGRGRACRPRACRRRRVARPLATGGQHPQPGQRVRRRRPLPGAGARRWSPSPTSTRRTSGSGSATAGPPTPSGRHPSTDLTVDAARRGLRGAQSRWSGCHPPTATGCLAVREVHRVRAAVLGALGRRVGDPSRRSPNPSFLDGHDFFGGRRWTPRACASRSWCGSTPTCPGTHSTFLRAALGVIDEDGMLGAAGAPWPPWRGDRTSPSASRGGGATARCASCPTVAGWWRPHRHGGHAGSG